VAAKDYWGRFPWRRFIARSLFRSVLIPRLAGVFGGRGILGPLVGELDRGGSLILFPEGTRGDGRNVRAFKGGLYHLCCERPGLEVVPVYLENMHEILPKGSIVPAPGNSRVTFGAPIALEAGEKKGEFLKRARQVLCDLRAR
jgi:1-acyl-sn-glycerol-3-phosphate acyltransferase